MQKNDAKTTQGLFETWVNAQKELVKNWSETAEKIQDTWTHSTNGNAWSDYFSSWYKNQMNQWSGGNGNRKETRETQEGNPVNYFTDWYKAQMDFAGKWYEHLNQGVKSGVSSSPLAPAAEQFEAWKGYDAKTRELWMAHFEALTRHFGAEKFSETWKKVWNSTESYMKMVEFWMPFFKSLEKGTINQGNFADYFNPARYKDFIDSLFHFDQNPWKSAWEQGQTWSKENLEKIFGEGFAKAGHSGFDNLGNFQKNWVEMMEKFSSPLMKMMTPGAAKDSMEDQSELFRFAGTWQTKMAQMQFMVYVTGTKALRTFAGELGQKVSTGGSTGTPMEMFTQWLKTNDQVFVELFASEEFSRVQADFTEATMKMRKLLDAQMEKSLAHVPVVPRSEMDELYKSLTEMNKRIKDLERKFRSGSGKEGQEATGKENKRS